MKRCKMLLALLCISTIILLPKKIALACGPWPAAPEEYRLSLYQPAIGDADNQLAAYYFSMNRYYKSEEITGFATGIEMNQNYAEWQNELKTPFSKKDFYKAIQDCSYQVIIDSANNLAKANSFIKVLLQKGSKDYFAYFKLAKSTEDFNARKASQDPWGLDDNTSTSAKPVVFAVQKFLKSPHNKFIQQRAAYIMCRLLFYGNRQDAFKNTYNAYFAKNTGTSWVNAAVKYYYVKLLYGDDSLHYREYYRGLTEVIDNCKDKRMACIQQLNYVDKSFVLPYLQNNHQKATVLAAYAARYPAYALNDIKKIFALDPGNKFIPLLIGREINKLEDWLLTANLTEYETSASKDTYLGYDDDTSGAIAKHFAAANRADDSAYALKVQAFITTLVTKNTRDYTMAMALCHLHFLLKDYTGAKTYCDRVLQSADKGSPEYLQAKINSVVLSFQIKQKLDDDEKSSIYNLLVYFDKMSGRSDADIDYYGDAKDMLLVYLGRSALKMGDVVNASLLLSGTQKPWGEYSTGMEKSAYFILYEYAKEKDFDSLAAILRKNNKSGFENYFCETQCTFYGNYSVGDNYNDARATGVNYWDINKVLDLKGTYFLNMDSLHKALDAFKQVPDKFWVDSANLYNTFLTGNPFELNIYNTHDFSPKPGVKNDPNKRRFVEKLLALKAILGGDIKNAETRAKIYYTIGNAYYSMSYYGKFWMMSKLWWSVDDPYEEDYKRPSYFGLNYYGTTRAELYYKRAFNTTKNPKQAAFYCMYLTNCENNRRDYLHYIKKEKTGKDNDSDVYTPDDFIFASLLRHKPGSDDFYKRLIKECPLYTDFRSKL